MKLKGRRVAILAENLYQDMEVWYPLYRLREEGCEVKVVGTGSADTYASKHGYPVQVDLTADQARIEDFDALVIPGGYAPDILRRYPAVLKLVREAHEKRKVLAAICHAGWVLASAGVLKGRKVTAFHAIRDDVVNAGAEFLDREVVVDGHLVTSRKPDDLPAFCREIIRLLEAQSR